MYFCTLIKGRNFGGNLIWRMAEKAFFRGNLIWRMAGKIKFNGNLILRLRDIFGQNRYQIGKKTYVLRSGKA